MDFGGSHETVKLQIKPFFLLTFIDFYITIKKIRHLSSAG